MKITYRLKGLFLLILLPATIYYFTNAALSEVRLSSFFTLVLTIVYMHDEFTFMSQRTSLQKIIDRLTLLILIILSLDILLSLFINGLA